MSVDTAQLEAIAHEILAVAGMFSPQVAGATVGVEALIKLLKSGQKFNGLIKDIIDQTADNKDEVRAAAIAAYAASEDNLQSALDAAREE